MKKRTSKFMEARRLMLEYIDEHKFLYSFTKEIIKEQALSEFRNIKTMIGLVEVSCRRTSSYHENEEPRQGTP